MLQYDPDKDFLLAGISKGFEIIQAGSDIQPAFCANHKSALSVENKCRVEKQILHEVNCNRYIITDVKPTIVSALGAVPKPHSSDIRLIHDCSRPLGLGLNSYAHPDSFTFNTVDGACKSIQRGYYMSKIDLKSAYRSVPIHPDHYPAAGLQWKFHGSHKPVYLYDTCLMFGASQAVSIFHRLSNALVRVIERYTAPGCVINYLDDFLILAPTKELALCYMHIALGVITSLGFVINFEKLVLPTTDIVFLGININSTQMMLYIPPDKLNEIKLKAAGWLSKKRATKRELQSLAGIISWGAKCVKSIRPILRSIINLYKGLRGPSHHVRISKLVQADICYFIQWCNSFNGVSFAVRTRPIATMYSDASLTAAAAYSHGDFLYSVFACDNSQYASQDIYVKELLAVLLALQRWAHAWAGYTVIARIDNQGVLGALHQGLTKNCIANGILKAILWYTAIYDIDLCPSYILSADNVIADCLSRGDDPVKFNMVTAGLLSYYGPNYFALPLPPHMTISSYLFLMHRYASRGLNFKHSSLS